MLEKIIHWVRVDSSDIGRPKYPGTTPSIPINEPMILLSLLEQIIEMDPSLGDRYKGQVDWCIKEILKHVQVLQKHILKGDWSDW